MHVAITGSSGLIGSALRASLTADGHRVVALVRRAPAGPDEVRWDPSAGTVDTAGLVGVDAVVHLAGAGIGDARWTEEYKRVLIDSRVEGTTTIARAIVELDPMPVLLSASGINFYGDRGDEELTEASAHGDGYLAEICRAWEGATEAAEAAGARVAHLRSGIVLSADGGALAKQLLPYRLGLGGRIGRGDQWVSWITLADEVRAIRHLLDHDVSGPANLCTPNPVTNVEFAKALGRALHRPAIVPIPRFVTKLPLGIGELAENLLFSGVRATPTVLAGDGFTFRHAQLDGALADVLGD